MTVLNFYSDRHRETPVGVFVTEPFGFSEEYRLAMIEEVAGPPPGSLRLDARYLERTLTRSAIRRR